MAEVQGVRWEPNGADTYTGLPTLELTRRNLTALLAKLDGHPSGSTCTLVDPDNQVAVRAVEDVEHYSNRPPGPMVEETESHLRGPGSQGGLTKFTRGLRAYRERQLRVQRTG